MMENKHSDRAEQCQTFGIGSPQREAVTALSRAHNCSRGEAAAAGGHRELHPGVPPAPCQSPPRGPSALAQAVFPGRGLSKDQTAATLKHRANTDMGELGLGGERVCFTGIQTGGFPWPRATFLL